MCHFELRGYVVRICVRELAICELAKIIRNKTWFLTSIALANGKGRVEISITTTKKKNSRNIFYRLLRRHEHEAVALYLQSRYTTLVNDVDKGRRTKTGIAKKCAGLKPVSQKSANN